MGQTPGLYEVHPPAEFHREGVIERRPSSDAEAEGKAAEKPLAVRQFERFMSSDKATESSSAALDSVSGNPKSPKVRPEMWVEPDTHIAVRSIVKGVV